MRNILITGGAGFVGRRFCKYFLDQGDRVFCVDPIATFTGGLHPNENIKGWPLFNPYDYDDFIFHCEDFRNYAKFDEGIDFDYAIHLAAVVGGREMIENNPLAVADDLSIDAAFWQWAVRNKPKKVVFFSSSAAYPTMFQTQKDMRPLLEKDILFYENGMFGQPDMSYGWAKLTGEYLAKLAYQKHGIKSVVYRPFSGYGEDQDDSYPFPAICKRLLEQKKYGDKEEFFKIWGSGDQIRDFIHIDDVVRCVTRTMDMIDNADALNISTGIGTTFKQFVIMAAELAGFTSLNIEGSTNKPEGVFSRVGDTALQRTFGFKPEITFKQGIKKMLEHLNEKSASNDNN